MMLGALRTQLASLSLRSSAATSGAAIRATGASFGGLHQFSTEAEATQDATSAFLDATEGDDVRTVKTMKMNIRYSPRKLTYLAQQIRGLPANEALLQMKFSPKRKAEIVRKTVQNAVNLADIKYQIEPENLQVAECFVNKGHYLKRLRIMGRGRSGIMHHPHSPPDCRAPRVRPVEEAAQPLPDQEAGARERREGDAGAGQ
ncbi:hypothetical protein PINS_up021665 [Pythium insidiosum]|nr:hypothetical protein PINS_up021665 [Pythium insidiosum]